MIKIGMSVKPKQPEQTSLIGGFSCFAGRSGLF